MGKLPQAEICENFICNVFPLFWFRVKRVSLELRVGRSSQRIWRTWLALVRLFSKVQQAVYRPHGTPIDVGK